MKTKKLLSVLLALATVVTMTAALTLTPSAASHDCFVGDTVSFYIDGQLGTDEVADNVKNIAIATGTYEETEEPFVGGQILNTEEGENEILVRVKATEVGLLAVSYQIYAEGAWKTRTEYPKIVLPTVTVGETLTYTLEDCTLYPDDTDGDVKNFTAQNATVVSAVQTDDDIVVTLKATAAGRINLAWDVKRGEEWETAYGKSRIAKAVLPSAYLDLESSTTDIKDSKDFETKYTLAQDGATTYVDVTKVKVEWTITDITATYSGSKTWDPDTLSWKELDKSDYNVTDGTASFKITNLSSVKVQAEVKFEAADDDFNPEVEILLGTEEKSKTVIGTAVDATNKETVAATAPSVTFTATVTPADTDFTELADTTSATLYGTYTVTISEAKHTVTFTGNDDCNVSFDTASVEVSDGTAVTFNAETLKFTVGTTVITMTAPTGYEETGEFWCNGDFAEFPITVTEDIEISFEAGN